MAGGAQMQDEAMAFALRVFGVVPELNPAAVVMLAMERGARVSSDPHWKNAYDAVLAANAALLDAARKVFAAASGKAREK